MPDAPDNWPYDEVTTRSLAALAAKVGNNPKTRLRALELFKEVEPNRRIPELETRDQVQAVRDELAAEKQERAQEKMTQTLERQKRKLTRDRDKGGFGLNAEDVTKVEALMEKHSLVDYDIAARVYMAERETADGTPASYEEANTMQLPGDKALFADPTKWAQGEAHRAITEAMKRNRAA